jgi:hypothetical protein
MPFEIKAKVTVGLRDDEITLPQGQNQFEIDLSNMGVYRGGQDEYTITSAVSSIAGLNPALAQAKDLHELNGLAQLLSRLDDDGLDTFGDMLKSEGDPLPMAQLVNLAYNFDDLNIEHSIHDIDELGRSYAEEEDPETDELIQSNLDDDGEIHYEGIGMELQISQGGLFTDAGYISNFDEMKSSPYEGQMLPAIYYDENPDYSVTLKKRGRRKRR